MRARKAPLVITVLIAVALVVPYLWAVASKQRLDEESRTSAPGEFVELPAGLVHYEIDGPPEGRPVVMIHGLVTPSFVWDQNVPSLLDAGFRVLRYDHYGRGYSDRPDVVYDRDLYDRQLLTLLDALEIEGPVDLVGLSMGGAVAITFADRHPERVSRLCLIAPAGFPIAEPWPMKLARVPVIGDYLMTVVGDRFLVEGVREAFVHPEMLAGFDEKFTATLRYRGLHHAVLSTLRHMRLTALEDTYVRVGKQNKPVLLVWGRQDRVLPFEGNEKVRRAIPRVEFHAIEGAGHNLNYENPEVVNPLLVAFLSERSAE